MGHTPPVNGSPSAVLSEALELRDEPQGPDYGPGLGLCQAPSEASIVMLLWKKIPPTKMSLRTVLFVPRENLLWNQKSGRLLVLFSFRVFL